MKMMQFRIKFLVNMLVTVLLFSCFSSAATRFEVTGTTEQLTDNTGLVYIGVVVPNIALEPMLAEFKQLVGDEKFAQFRLNQAKRDHQQFHMTLVNPFELKALAQAPKIGEAVKLSLVGLGMANAKDDSQHQVYFVVVESTEGQQYRQSLELKAKDFHITLGFNPSDVFGVAKNRASLVK